MRESFSEEDHTIRVRSRSGSGGSTGKCRPATPPTPSPPTSPTTVTATIHLNEGRGGPQNKKSPLLFNLNKKTTSSGHHKSNSLHAPKNQVVRCRSEIIQKNFSRSTESSSSSSTSSNSSTDDEEEEAEDRKKKNLHLTIPPTNAVGVVTVTSPPPTPSSSVEEEEEEESSTPRDRRSVCRDECLDMLDGLHILKTIGTGTFGRVVLVQSKETEEYSALKILALPDLIRLKQVDHVKNEKNILQSVHHPFIVNMTWHGKDEYNIYMMFDYVCGGELFSYLRSAGKFPSSTCAFYAAEIVLTLEYLHSKSVVYRDLKPENLLLDREGHLKLTDFGFAKFLKDRTWTLCGTPEYLAPEIIQSKGHNKAVDWWALGVLIYEMHVGYAPFFDDNNFSTYEKILEAKVEWPRWVNLVAKDLMKKLLVPDRIKRLGSMKNGAEDVKRHRWFREFDWNDVLNRRLQPPIIPQVSSEGDTHNFDEYPEQDSWKVQTVDEDSLQLFDDF